MTAVGRIITELTELADPGVLRKTVKDASAGMKPTARDISAGRDTGTHGLPALLDLIEAEMASSPEVLQWSQNEVLAQIGIAHPELRDRALAVGEELGVFRDYPTAKNCVSPFAPVWTTEMVARQR